MSLKLSVLDYNFLLVRHRINKLPCATLCDGAEELQQQFFRNRSFVSGFMREHNCPLSVIGTQLPGC